MMSDIFEEFLPPHAKVTISMTQLLYMILAHGNKSALGISDCYNVTLFICLFVCLARWRTKSVSHGML